MIEFVKSKISGLSRFPCLGFVADPNVPAITSDNCGKGVRYVRRRFRRWIFEGGDIGGKNDFGTSLDVILIRLVLSMRYSVWFLFWNVDFLLYFVCYPMFFCFVFVIKVFNVKFSQIATNSKQLIRTWIYCSGSPGLAPESLRLPSSRVRDCRLRSAGRSVSCRFASSVVIIICSPTRYDSDPR